MSPGGATLLDVNVLIALAWPQHVHHDLVHEWFARASQSPWATCAVTQLAFVRISSNPAIVDGAVEPGAAVDALDALTSAPRHVYWSDLPGLSEFAAFRSPLLVGHRQVTGLYLLELALARGGRLATLDRGLVQLARADRRLSAIVLSLAAAGGTRVPPTPSRLRTSRGSHRSSADRSRRRCPSPSPRPSR